MGAERTVVQAWVWLWVWMECVVWVWLWVCEGGSKGVEVDVSRA